MRRARAHQAEAQRQVRSGGNRIYAVVWTSGRRPGLGSRSGSLQIVFNYLPSLNVEVEIACRPWIFRNCGSERGMGKPEFQEYIPSPQDEVADD
jgi:hypothetical protein